MVQQFLSFRFCYNIQLKSYFSLRHKEYMFSILIIPYQFLYTGLQNVFHSNLLFSNYFMLLIKIVKTLDFKKKINFRYNINQNIGILKIILPKFCN